MSRIRECFVCGTLLASSEKQRVRVKHKRDKNRIAEVCRLCWWKVRAAAELRVVKDRKVYDLTVRRSQIDLFPATAKSCIGRGARDG